MSSNPFLSPSVPSPPAIKRATGGRKGGNPFGGKSSPTKSAPPVPRSRPPSSLISDVSISRGDDASVNPFSSSRDIPRKAAPPPPTSVVEERGVFDQREHSSMMGRTTSEMEAPPRQADRQTSLHEVYNPRETTSLSSSFSKTYNSHLMRPFSNRQRDLAERGAGGAGASTPTLLNVGIQGNDITGGSGATGTSGDKIVDGQDKTKAGSGEGDFGFLSSYHNSLEFSDMMFAVRSQPGSTTEDAPVTKVPAHRILVATFNECLKKKCVVNSGSDGGGAPPIDLTEDDIVAASLLKLLLFIYARKPVRPGDLKPMGTKELCSLLNGAKALGMQQAAESCRDELHERINSDVHSSLIGILVYADEKVDDRLYKACLEKITKLASATFNSLFNSISATNIINQQSSEDPEVESAEDSLPTTMKTDLCVRVVKAKSKAPVALAVTLQLNEVVDLLLSQGEDPNRTNDEGVHPLQIALETQNDFVVQKLIQYCGKTSANVLAHGTEEEGETLLHVSAMAGNVQHCRILLEAGAEINAQNSAGRSALHYATLCGSSDLVKLLLEASAIPNLQDNAGLTAAHVIAGDPLFKRGLAVDDGEAMSPPKHRGKAGGGSAGRGARAGGRTPAAVGSPRKSFMQMPEASMISTMQHLVDFRANFHMPDKHGRTPLHIAAFMAPPQVVAQMLSHGGDVHAKDYFNETPLHIAVRAPHYPAEVCDLLLKEVEGNADYLNMPNNDGNSPLHIACQTTHLESVKIISKLLSSGSYPNNVNNLSCAPLHILANHSVPSNVQMANAQTRSRVAKDTSAAKRENSMGDRLDADERIQAVATFFGDTSPSKSPQRHRNIGRRKSRSGNVVAKIQDDGGGCSRSPQRGNTEERNRKNTRELVRVFAGAGADVNLQTKDGGTPLHFSLTHDNDELAYALVHFGASLGLVDKHGRTPIQAMKGNDQNISARITVLLSSISLPPAWAPDDIFDSCMVCNRTFSTTVRRHHCRHCGRLICGKCSSKKCKITKPKFLESGSTFKKSQRVCNPCYDVLAFPLASGMGKE